MNPTVEERLHEYADTLNEAARAHDAESPARGDLPVARLHSPAGQSRGLGTRRIVAKVAVASVLVAAVAVTATIVGARNDHTSVTTRSAPTTVPSSEDGLRTLFARTTPNGIVIVARAGLVPIAAADQPNACPLIPVPKTQPANGDCTIGKAPGVQVDYSTGGHSYRATLLNRDLSPGPSPNLQPMMTLAQIRQVLPNGDTVPLSGGPSPYLVILHSTDIATVRVNPTRTTANGLDEMTPVDGWVAFAADNSPTNPFDPAVQGLNPTGTVIATALPWRCC